MLNKLKSAYLWLVMGFATLFAKLSLKLGRHVLSLQGLDESKFEYVQPAGFYNKQLTEKFAELLGNDQPAYETGFNPQDFLKKKFNLTDIEVVNITDLSKKDDTVTQEFSEADKDKVKVLDEKLEIVQESRSKESAFTDSFTKEV